MKLISLFIISSGLIIGCSNAVNIPGRVFGGCIQISLHNLYCMGGKSSNSENATVYKDIYSMYLGNMGGLPPNQIATSWSPVKYELPYPNSDFLMVPVEYSGFSMLGGSGSVGNSTNPPIYSNSPPYDAPWKVGSLSALPPLRGSAVYMDTSTRGYILGGATYGNTSTFFADILSLKYDFSTKNIVLTNIGTINTYKIGHSLVNHNNYLYVLGGQEFINNQLRSVPMNQMSRFDTVTSAWTIVNLNGPIPTPRSYFTLTSAYEFYRSGGFVLFGGINADTNVVSTDKLFILYVNTGTYESLDTTNSPSARYGHSAVDHVLSNIIILNGMDANGVALNDFHVFDMNTRKWVSTFSSDGKSSDSPNAITYKYYIDAEVQGANWGIAIAVIVFIHLIGFGLYKYVQKKSPHHETNVNVDSSEIKESDQYNEQNNNYNYQSASPSTDQYNDNSIYQSSSLPISSSPPIDHRPLPPTPVMSMPTGPQYGTSSSPIFYQQDVPYSQR